MRVLLGICGGIAAYKSAYLVRRLTERGHEVRCALTANAAAFVAPLTLEVLSGAPVYQEEYLEAQGQAKELHIEAARWAQVLCVAPITAHTLARLALGLADDFLTTTALAFDGPRLLAPAMHPVMWAKATVQEHRGVLSRSGARILGPARGPLASGETGLGRMVEPDEIVAAVEELVQPEPGVRPLGGRRVLVTAGPTHEPIDPVRFLANRSSGKMGFALAREAARRGAQVLLVAGPVLQDTPAGVERHDVTTALEMQAALHRIAPDCDLIIMAAAVSDYRPGTVAEEKIKRRQPHLSLTLETNPDILMGLAEVAPEALRVGFAAETHQLDHHARAKLKSKKVDFLVANDVSRSDIGFASDSNEVVVYRQEGAAVHLSRKPKSEIAAELLDLFTAALGEKTGPERPASGGEPPE